MGTAARAIVIAHRGASGYLPEHTLPSKALAFAMGADYLEQDVVATRDGALIVFHDLTLGQTTDVARRYPGRQRADGQFYCRDFDLAEIRTLGVGPRLGEDGQVRYPDRFPEEGGRFGIPTLEEEIRFIQGLVRSTGRSVGIYPEIKDPAWHRGEGIDIGVQVLRTLADCGCGGADLPVFLQCFDPAELQRLRREFAPPWPLVQLIDSGSGLPSARDLASIAAYAQAIGPSMKLLYRGASAAARLSTGLVDAAHAAGLAVHPYTFRRDDLPDGIGSFEELLEMFLLDLGVDGLFTDFPDLAVRFLDRHRPG